MILFLNEKRKKQSDFRWIYITRLKNFQMVFTFMMIQKMKRIIQIVFLREETFSKNKGNQQYEI